MSHSILEEIKQTKPFKSKGQEALVALLRTNDLIRRHFARIIEPHGITQQQYNVLRILRGAGPDGLPTLSIGERMLEQTPGITRIIDRLERHKWVERSRCSEDRRRVLCHITDEGLEVVNRLDAPMDVADDLPFKSLSEPEIEEFIRLLGEIRASLREPG